MSVGWKFSGIMKSVVFGDDPLSRQPKVQIGKNLVSFFGDNLPPFPSPSGDIDVLYKSRLYSQASGLADKLLASAPVNAQLDILTIKLASLLSLQTVPAAMAALTNYFGTSDLSETSLWKGVSVPVKLRVLSCLSHHFNGDTNRALSALYRVLKSTADDQQYLVLTTLAKLQASLGDIDEVTRLLAHPRFDGLKSNILQISGFSITESGKFASMALGDYGAAAEAFKASGDAHNEAIAALYNCEHSRCVDLLESCIRADPVKKINSGLLNNLFAVYGFYRENLAERKISAVNEVTKFYCPEAGLFSNKQS